MNRKRILLGVIFISLVFFGVKNIFSQEQGAGKTPVPALGDAAKAPEAEQAAAPEIEWVWGEVLRVDPAANTLTVKYLDYETDMEKEITLMVEEDTIFEEINSLSGLQPQDTVSVDYIVSKEGKNVAQNISLEKGEDASQMQEDKGEFLPPVEPTVAPPAEELGPDNKEAPSP